jgi:hypothetical protein
MSSVRWLSYSFQQGIQWMGERAAGRTATTVGARSSGIALVAQVMDLLSDPAAIAPRGATTTEFPKLTYPGPIEEFAGKRCPVVGTYGPPPAGSERAVLWGALHEQLRILSHAMPTPAATPTTAPAGLLLQGSYPAGVLGVDGIAAQCIQPADEPGAALEDKDPASQAVSQVMLLAMPVADQLTNASAHGQEARDVVFATIHSQTDPALQAALQALANKAAVYNRMGETANKRATKYAAGVGVALLAACGLVRATMKRRQGRGAGYVQLGSGG